jgi:outer membrane lipoprotein SlyB
MANNEAKSDNPVVRAANNRIVRAALLGAVGGAIGAAVGGSVGSHIWAAFSSFIGHEVVKNDRGVPNPGAHPLQEG